MNRPAYARCLEQRATHHRSLMSAIINIYVAGRRLSSVMRKLLSERLVHEGAMCSGFHYGLKWEVGLADEPFSFNWHPTLGAVEGF